MNRDDMNNLLADYLGDELAPEDRRRFEAYLAVDADFAREVAEMQSALAAMRSLDEPALLVSAEPSSSLRFPRSRTATLLRYAATVLFAFAGGYAARSIAPAGDSRPAIVEPQQSRDRGASGFEQRFAEAYGRSAAQSDLARSLIALSRAMQ